MLVFIPHWPQASTYLACQALGFATGLLAAVALSRWAIGEWPGASALHGGPFNDLVSLGVWQLVAQGSGLIAVQADRYLLGALLAPQFVGFYTIAQRLEEAIYIGILKIGEILFPFFSVLQKRIQRTEGRSAFSSLLGSLTCSPRVRLERWSPLPDRCFTSGPAPSGCRSPTGAGGAYDRRNAGMQRERVRILSVSQR